MNSGPALAAGLRGNCPDLVNLNDSELLARFFQDKVDAAFATIVERHGPLVYGVCRRILADPNDAEDAFQATFLVLVRKGGTLRDPARLSSWLYGVAHRTARKLRAKAMLRTKSERQASQMPTKSDHHELTYDELQKILDEEIGQLPEKYALPLILCYLEGKTNAQAALQLGWPEGSISRRLSRARELLKSRLSKRGLAISAALITAVFARPAVAAVPSGLLAATTRAATLAAEGVALEEVVSPATAKVIHEVVSSMSAAGKFAIPTIAVVASLLLVLTSAVWQFGNPVVHAAGLFRSNRAAAVHGLTTTPTGGAVTSLSAAGASEGGCASACGTATPTTPAP